MGTPHEKRVDNPQSTPANHSHCGRLQGAGAPPSVCAEVHRCLACGGEKTLAQVTLRSSKGLEQLARL
eukprot:6180699-Pleurochrysis_carterae.AAC.2